MQSVVSCISIHKSVQTTHRSAVHTAVTVARERERVRREVCLEKPAVKVERSFVLNVVKVLQEYAESHLTVRYCSHTVSVASQYC